MRVDQLDVQDFHRVRAAVSVRWTHEPTSSGTRGAERLPTIPRYLVRDTDSTRLTAMLASLASLSRGPRPGTGLLRATRIHRRQTLAAWPGPLSVAQRVQPEHLVLVAHFRGVAT